MARTKVLHQMFDESVSSGDLETIRSLVEMKGLDINSIMWSSMAQITQRSALHWAAFWEHPAIIEYLVLKGANLEATNIRGQTPLLEAVATGRVESARTLVRLGAKTNALCKDGKNILHHAMRAYSPGIYNRQLVHIVLELEFYDSPDQYKQLLLASAEEGDLETIKTLVGIKNVDIHYGLSDNALHRAARKGHLEIVEYLVLKGADIEAKDFQGQTPLFSAVKFGHIEIAKLLVRLGAKTDVEDYQGENLLHAAAFFVNKNYKMISFALDLGFNINQYDNDGLTPLMRSESEDCTALLLKKGADYRKYSVPDGWSVLHFAARNESQVLLIKVLLEHVEKCEGRAGLLGYVDYNGTNNGRTALHLAVIKRNHLGAKLLLGRGANPGINDILGKVPYDYVRDGNNESTVLMRSVFEDMQRNRR